MKFTKLITALFILINFISCNTKDALEFNDKLVGIQKSLTTEIDKMKPDSVDGMAKLLKVQQLTKTKIAEAKAVKAPENGEAFKQAIIDDFDGIVTTYDILINMLKQEGNETELQKLQDELETWTKKIERLDDNVLVEQKKFADKYNLRIENK